MNKEEKIKSIGKEIDYIKCLINSGMHYISNGFICAGLFNQSNYNLLYYPDIYHYTSKLLALYYV